MVTLNDLPPSDRTLAALGHLSILLPGLGLLGPLILWIMGRQRSHELRLQLIQAGLLQTLQPLAALLAGLVVAVTGFAILLINGLVADLRLGGAGQLWPLFGPTVIAAAGAYCLVGLGFVLFGLIAAFTCWRGSAYRYPWMGLRLVVYLDEYKSHEQNALAALCHLGLYAGLAGLIGSLLVWITSPKEERRLHFQSLQAGMYQIIGLVAGLVSWAVVSLLVAASGFSLALSQGEFSGLNGLGTAIMGLLALLCAGGFVLAVPVYQTLPILAAVRIGRDREYLYPFLGKIISNIHSKQDNPL